jgi:hypothetical protein
MPIHNKTSPSCCRVQSPFTGCSAPEIELKKICRLLSEAPWRALVLLSKDVVEKLWSFVKFYGYENRSRGLVRYVILYSVTPSNSFKFGTSPRAPLAFSKFQKSGHFGLPPPKDQQGLRLPNWVSAFQIGIDVTSEVRFCVRDKQKGRVRGREG